MSDNQKKLDDIRRRFVGTGEEHDLLKSLCDHHEDIYQRGFKEGREYMESDRRILNLASNVVGGMPIETSLIEWSDDSEWSAKYVVEGMKKYGMTQARFDKLVAAWDAMHKEEQPT